MPNTQPARHEEPFFNHAGTADDFESALKDAARANAVSMENLHQAIIACVTGLRADGMQCEAALLTIKACVRHTARKHCNEVAYNVAGSDYLMDQIVRWSIVEFYNYD